MAITDAHDRASATRKRDKRAFRRAVEQKMRALEQADKRAARSRQVARESTKRKPRTKRATRGTPLGEMLAGLTPTTREQRSREIVQESRVPKVRPVAERVHGRDAIENLRSYGRPSRGRRSQAVENLRARTTADERKVLSREEAAKAGTKSRERRKLVERIEAAGIDPRGAKGFAERIGSDIESFAVNLPGGVYQVGKAVAKDIARGQRGDFSRSETLELGKAVGKQLSRDYSDPVGYAKEHPGFVGLDVLAVLSGGAGAASRASAAGRAAKEASRAGRPRLAAALARPTSAGGSLLRRPPPGPRTHVYEGQPVQGMHSTSPLVRGVQRAADVARERRGAPLTGRRPAPGAPLSTISPRKAGRLIAQERRILDAAEKAPALRAAAVGKKLTTQENVAVRVVAEGLPLDDVVRFHAEMAGATRGKIRKQHARRLALLEAARPYLAVDDAGRPTIAAGNAKLERAVQVAEEAVGKREKGLQAAGLLSPESIASRRDAPGRLMAGGQAVADEAATTRLRTLERELRKGLRPVVDEMFPVAARQREQALRNVVYRLPKDIRPPEFRGGIPRKPGTVTNPYTGAIRRAGGTTTDTMRAVAEDALQAERYLSVDRLRARVVPMGRKARPEGRQWVPVKERPLRKNEAAELRRTLAEADITTLTPDEAARLDAVLGRFRNELFPDGDAPPWRTRMPEVRVGEEVPGVVWVDRKLLGDMKRIVPGRVPYLDPLSDAVRGFVLYLKPGYVAPNVLGNVGFNIIQQGFLAPANWVRATRLPKEVGYLVDSVMGEGFARALGPGPRSAGVGFGRQVSGTVSGVANVWGKFVDVPFRRAAFIHEARVAGFDTPAKMGALIEKSANRSKLTEVGQRARDAIVDYERLSPVEQDVIRRAVFVYPWLRGSAHYAGQFLRDHPIQAAVYARLGRESGAQSLEELGELPGYAEGSFRVGGTDEQPRLVNPRYVNPLETLGQAAAMGAGSLGLDDVERDERLGTTLNPLLKAAAETVFRRDLFTGQEIEGGLEMPLDRLTRGFPQRTLLDRAQRLGGDESRRSYPVESAYDVAAPFVGGSAVPRRANLENLNEQARRDARAKLEPAERVRADYAVERNTVLPALRGEIDPEDLQHVERAYSIGERMDMLRAEVGAEVGDGEPYYRAVMEAEAKLLGDLGYAEAEDVAFLVEIARTASFEELKSRRSKLIAGPYERLYLKAVRAARKQAGYGA